MLRFVFVQLLVANDILTRIFTSLGSSMQHGSQLK